MSRGGHATAALRRRLPRQRPGRLPQLVKDALAKPHHARLGDRLGLCCGEQKLRGHRRQHGRWQRDHLETATGEKELQEGRNAVRKGTWIITGGRHPCPPAIPLPGSSAPRRAAEQPPPVTVPPCSPPGRNSRGGQGPLRGQVLQLLQFYPTYPGEIQTSYGIILEMVILLRDDGSPAGSLELLVVEHLPSFVWESEVQ